MDQQLSEEQLRQGRAILEASLTPEDLNQLKHLLDEATTSNLSQEQKSAIRALFHSFGLL